MAIKQQAAGYGWLKIGATPFGIEPDNQYAYDPDMVNACYRYIYSSQGNLLNATDLAAFIGQIRTAGPKILSWKELAHSVSATVAEYCTAKRKTIREARQHLYGGSLDYRANTLAALGIQYSTANLGVIMKRETRLMVSNQLELEAEIWGLDINILAGCLAALTMSDTEGIIDNEGASIILEFWGARSFVFPTKFAKYGAIKNKWTLVKGRMGSKSRRKRGRNGGGYSKYPPGFNSIYQVKEKGGEKGEGKEEII